ncbi:hypothetical protein [Saccharothrix variisporea]|uniref:AbiEi antitoxin C-terminal domain-containing protein n=1 Tax=Saccharothrix variisporea TaxID=543527 RepID=A0A495XFG4_9PSEU|nr:hypothetical protein [Saccharothrix variisporea]RKT73191.1 hypothetical protein DFJ66_6520 [Saccharothrix variisporea]
MHTKTRTTITVDALATLFPHQVTTAADLISLGLDHEELTDRCERSEWQRVLPGVLLLSRKPPTRLQRVQAALRYGGPGALLTGLDALHLHGLRTVPATGPIYILAGRPVEPAEGIKALRPRSHIEPVLRRGFPTAPLIRAVTDTTRFQTDPHALRAILTDAVRRGGIPPADLLRLLSKRGEETRRILTDLATSPPPPALPRPRVPYPRPHRPPTPNPTLRSPE